MTEESAVTVCVRVRPLIAREEKAASGRPEPLQHFWKADKKSIHQIEEDGTLTKTFSFDRVFTADETTNQLYQAIAKPLVVSSVEGYNGTIFAYGQTSSGKTFTMMGEGGSLGVIPLAVEEVFQSIKNFPKKEFLLRVSYMEIYNETVTDLLVDSWKRKPLEVREAINKTIFVADLTEELVTTPAQTLAWIRKGEDNRHYGKTEMNQRSSRSHTIFRMILESRELSDPSSGENADGAIIVSHLNLVDLAGSERVSQTGAEGARFKEGCNINRSLFTLGQVIKKLTDDSQKGFTNYRDSKLTRILQNSLGGNAKTGIICTVTSVELENTLSTLQFASTAKKMKNDPHVTEVSDDGALLKRYRNEIVDLKRRLQEVSSETQTTATEKEVLSQLLQEKEMLQREQEDRIRNLTQLLVTSSNQVPVTKVPKRRVTWGGNTFTLASQPLGHMALADRSLLDSRKRKAERLLELCEEEDFDPHWGIPEVSPELELGRSVTVRNCDYRLRSPVSPEWAAEASGTTSSLELQLEAERQQKEEALARMDVLNERVNELQCQMEAREGRESPGTSELEVQLQAEAEQRRQAVERVEMLELKLGDLEQQKQSLSEADEQTRRQFAETIQLCETLASEKELVVAERDYLKDELDMLVEQKASVEQERAALSQELREKKEMEEFQALEEQFRKEQENDLEKEVSGLRTALQTSAAKCLELQHELDEVSEEMRRNRDVVEELQRMNGKELVQEVATLRRSLDDAQGVSRDTKKEWALLRSQNIALEENNLTLSASQEKMEAELNSLRLQLENGKTRYKNMQSDLQKELNVAFEENTKLTALLAGKVPKNLTDSVELERDVARLNKELSVSREVEEALRTQLESLPREVTALNQQLQEAEQHKAELEGRVSEMQQMVEAVQEKLAHSEASTGTEEEISRELQEQVKQLSEELHRVHAEKDALLSEQSAAASTVAEEKETLLCTVSSLRADGEQLRAQLQEHIHTAEQTQGLLQSLRAQLQEQAQRNADLVKVCEQKDADVEAQVLTLSEELQRVRTEKELLLQTGARTSVEELDGLRSAVAAVTEERDQLRVDMQENMDIMIDVQEELRSALEKNQKQKELIKRLQTTQEPPPDAYTQLKELQAHIKTQEEQLESVQAERDALLSQRTEDTQRSMEEKEELLSRVKALSEDRDQLQQILDGLRQDKQQLQLQLEDRMEMVQCELQQQRLSSPTQTVGDEQQAELLLQIQQLEEHLERSKEELSQLNLELQTQVEKAAQLGVSYQTVREEKLQLEEDLLQKISTESSTEELLKRVQDELLLLKDVQKNLEEQSNEREGSYNNQITDLTEELDGLRAERSALLSEMEKNGQRSMEEKEELLSRVKALREDRDQLQQILDGLRQDKQQLQVQLEDRMEMVQSQVRGLTEGLNMMEAERDALLSQRTEDTQRSMEEKEELLSRVKALSEDRDQLQQILDGLRQDKQQLQLQLEDRMEMVQCELQQQRLSSPTQTVGDEQQAELLLQIQQLEEHLERSKEELSQLNLELQTQVEKVLEQLDRRLPAAQLGVSYQTVREEKLQLEEDLLQKISTESSTEELLKRVQDELLLLKDVQKNLEEQSNEREGSYNNQIRDLTEELDGLRAERSALLSEMEKNGQRSMEEKEELLSRVKALSEDRDQLQQILDGLRQDKQQLQVQLEDRMEMISTIQERQNQPEESSDAWKCQVQQLEEQLRLQQQLHANAEAEAQKLLNDANEAMSSLREQVSSARSRETMSSRLQASTEQLQEAFEKIQKLVDICAYHEPELLEYNFSDFDSLAEAYNVFVPESTERIYREMCEAQRPTIDRLISFAAEVHVRAQRYRKTFGELVRMDLEAFEERRLQDVLICRSTAPSLSVKDQDFSLVWERRLGELLDRRQLYIQKMSNAITMVASSMDSYFHVFHPELRELDRFTNQVHALMKKEPIDFEEVNSLVIREQERRLAQAARCTEVPVQNILSEHNVLLEELQQLEAAAVSQLQREKSKRSTMMQAVEGAPVQSELSLLKDNQQLVLQLQEVEHKLKVLREQNEQLQESQIKASNRVSSQKEATQLLQTELQDSRALVEEKETTIQSLKSRLRESETNVPPTAAQLEVLKGKLIQLEAQLASTSEEHKQEVQRMTSLLSSKDDSLRSLKEALRKSLHQGEDSILQGEELHARLTSSRGLGVKSSVLQEKSKLEEKVKLLQAKISELERSASSQQEEINKWKSRAIKAKGKSRAESEKPSSPCTPTKRGPPLTDDATNLFSSPKKFLLTPKKVLESPNKLDSPKSRFFDLGQRSELLSRTCPKQFFDNSRLGTDPDVASQTRDSWPTSPKMEEMCKTQ